MYGDKITRSMKKAIEETERRRKIQTEFNKKHGITPTTIKKNIAEIIQVTKSTKDVEEINEEFSHEQVENILINLESEMYKAAEELDFERAAEIRDQIAKLKREFAGV